VHPAFVDDVAGKWKTGRIVVIVCRREVCGGIWTETAIFLCWNGITLYWCCCCAEV